MSKQQSAADLCQAEVLLLGCLRSLPDEAKVLVQLHSTLSLATPRTSPWALCGMVSIALGAYHKSRHYGQLLGVQDLVLDLILGAGRLCLQSCTCRVQSALKARNADPVESRVPRLRWLPYCCVRDYANARPNMDLGSSLHWRKLC